MLTMFDGSNIVLKTVSDMCNRSATFFVIASTLASHQTQLRISFFAVGFDLQTVSEQPNNVSKNRSDMSNRSAIIFEVASTVASQLTQ